jgi:hypothetical protein
MDSLMAVELKVRLEEHSGCVLPIDGLGAEMTVARLAERLLGQMSAAESDRNSQTVSSKPQAVATHFKQRAGRHLQP